MSAAIRAVRTLSLPGGAPYTSADDNTPEDNRQDRQKNTNLYNYLAKVCFFHKKT